MADSLAHSIQHNSVLHSQEQSTNTIPVVFIHGWGLNSAVWQPLLAELSNKLPKHFQLQSIDLPGFGQNSQQTVSLYNVDEVCHFIYKKIQRPAIYLGWSLGGLIASKIALNYPQDVLGLITVASSPYFVEQEANEKNTSDIYWPGIKSHVLASFHQQLSQDTAKTIKGFLKIQAMGSPHIRQDLKQITELVMAQPLPDKTTLDDSLKLLETIDLREQLSSIQQPFLRLYGRNDSLVPKETSLRVSALAPKSEQFVFNNASHAPFISHVDEFKKKLIQWLTVHF